MNWNRLLILALLFCTLLCKKGNKQLQENTTIRIAGPSNFAKIIDNANPIHKGIALEVIEIKEPSKAKSLYLYSLSTHSPYIDIYIMDIRWLSDLRQWLAIINDKALGNTLRDDLIEGLQEKDGFIALPISMDCLLLFSNSVNGITANIPVNSSLKQIKKLSLDENYIGESLISIFPSFGGNIPYKTLYCPESVSALSFLTENKAVKITSNALKRLKQDESTFAPASLLLSHDRIQVNNDNEGDYILPALSYLICINGASTNKERATSAIKGLLSKDFQIRGEEMGLWLSPLKEEITLQGRIMEIKSLFKKIRLVNMMTTGEERGIISLGMRDVISNVSTPEEALKRMEAIRLAKNPQD